MIYIGYTGQLANWRIHSVIKKNSVSPIEFYCFGTWRSFQRRVAELKPRNFGIRSGIAVTDLCTQLLHNSAILKSVLQFLNSVKHYSGTDPGL